MAEIGNIFQQTNPYEKFVQQLVQIESLPKLRLQAQQSENNERKSALGAVSSSISKFITNITELAEPENKSFQPLSTASSDESVVKINSASGIDGPSNYNITVNRIASNDIALSEVMTGDGFDLAAQGAGSVSITIGDKTETITVDTQKDDGTGTMVDMSNREILDSFATEISNLFGDEARASVFTLNDTEVQFSMQSLQTGFDNRIQISGGTGVLAQITGGFTHLTPQNELDANFTIDGVTFERSENTVDDAIDGLSFTLQKASAEEVKMSMERNLEKARENIDSFISSFNGMNKTIRDRTFLDAENDRRGALQDMRSIRNLTMNLRQTALLPMENAAPGELARLSEIGIGFKNDGTMHIEDSDLLEEMLTERPDELSKLFTDEQSTVAKMKEMAESYTKSEGIIASLETSLDQKLSRIDRRIEAQDRYLEKYEEQQRAKFNELQLIIDRGTAQFNQVASVRNSLRY